MWKNRKMEWMLLSVTKMLKLRNLVKRVSYALLLFMFASFDLCANELIYFKAKKLPALFLTSYCYSGSNYVYRYYINKFTDYPKSAILYLKGLGPHAAENSYVSYVSFYREYSGERWWSIDDYAFNNSDIKTLEWTDKEWRIGHFAWFSEQDTLLWVKLRGKSLVVLFGVLQTTLYLSIAV